MINLKTIILILLILCFISLAAVSYIIYNGQIIKITGLSEDLQETHQSLKTAENELSEVNKENTNLITKNKKLNKQAALSKERALKIKQAKEDIEIERNALYQEKEKLKNTLTETKESLNKRINRLEVKKEELGKSFQEKLESEKERFGAEKEALDKQIKSAKAMVEPLAAKNKKLLSELDKNNQMLAEYNAYGASKRLEKTKEELKDKISKLNKAIKENEKLTLQLTKSKEMIDGLSEEREGIEVQLAGAEQKLKGDTVAAINRQDLIERLKNTRGELSEEKLKFHYNMGLAYDEERRYKEALLEYKKALKFAPDDPDVHYNVAIIYDEHLINKKKAIKHYEAYLKLSPGAEDFDKVTYWISRAKQDLEWGRDYFLPQ